MVVLKSYLSLNECLYGSLHHSESCQWEEWTDSVCDSSSQSSSSSSRCFCLKNCLLLVHSDVGQSSTVTVHTLFIILMFVCSSAVCCLSGISVVRVRSIWERVRCDQGRTFTYESSQCDSIVHVLQCSLYPQPVLPLNCNSLQRVQQMKTTTINCNAIPDCSIRILFLLCLSVFLSVVLQYAFLSPGIAAKVSSV